MTATATDITPHRMTRRKSRRRPARAGWPLLGAAETADAPNAEDESAAELVADLAALVEAGLIAPVEQHGAVRYAVIDPDGPAA